ncbi:MAG: hypothetical protein JWM07_329 [Candidatus Saccharibacteria bacterium]|nr:hypothetical protein [Candidatus Saccharibacteria bacterium]
MNYHKPSKETTIRDLFARRYAVIEPLLFYCRGAQVPYAYADEREVMSLFTDFINTDIGGILVRQWYRQSQHTLAMIEYVDCNQNTASDELVRLAHTAASIEIDTLSARLLAAAI